MGTTAAASTSVAASRAHPRQEFQLPAHLLDGEREAAAGAGGQHRIGCQPRQQVCNATATRMVKPAFQTRLTIPLALRSDDARSTTETGVPAATASNAAE